MAGDNKNYINKKTVRNEKELTTKMGVTVRIILNWLSAI